MREGTRSGVRAAARQMVAAAASVPVVIGFTVLGAGVLVGRGLIGLLSRLLPFVSAEDPMPRHHAGRVREQVRAAKHAARAAGVLGARRRR